LSRETIATLKFGATQAGSIRRLQLHRQTTLCRSGCLFNHRQQF